MDLDTGLERKFARFDDEALTYALRHRLRGQLGTETVQGGDWPAGSFVVRLDGTSLQIGMAEGKRGLLRHYRVGPAGRPMDDDAYQYGALAFDGIGLKPYSPVHLRGVLEPGGDLNYSWIRRTRIGGDIWNTPDVPLNEESEQYLLRVMQGATLLREEMLTAPSWSYPSALRAADGLNGDFDIEVAQVSASFGPGTFAVLPQSI